MKHQIFLALGSNVGDKTGNIQKATLLLKKKVLSGKTANFYESKAAGFTDQDNFINTVIEGNTKLSPEELLDFVKKIEKKVGRVKRFHWGPREIDIDILFYDDLVYKKENLQIPHPRIQERDFVLKPLSDIAPNKIHPEINKSILELLKDLPPASVSIIRDLK